MGKLWAGIIGYEGLKTGDSRYIEPGALNWGTLPIPLRYVSSDVGAHHGAEVAGHINRIERLAPNEQGIVGIWASGDFDEGGPTGLEALRQVEGRLTNGISMDLDDVAFEVRSADNGQQDPRARLVKMLTGQQLGEDPDAVTVTTSARVRAGTLVAIPAFADARIELAGETDESTGNVSTFAPTESTPVVVEQPLALVASGAVADFARRRQLERAALALRARKLAARAGRTQHFTMQMTAGESVEAEGGDALPFADSRVATFAYNPLQLRDPENGRWIDSPTKAFREISKLSRDIDSIYPGSNDPWKSQFQTSLGNLDDAGQGFDDAVVKGDLDGANEALDKADVALNDLQSAAAYGKDAGVIQTQIENGIQGVSTLKDQGTLSGIIQQAADNAISGKFDEPSKASTPSFGDGFAPSAPEAPEAPAEAPVSEPSAATAPPHVILTGTHQGKSVSDLSDAQLANAHSESKFTISAANAARNSSSAATRSKGNRALVGAATDRAQIEAEQERRAQAKAAAAEAAAAAPTPETPEEKPLAGGLVPSHHPAGNLNKASKLQAGDVVSHPRLGNAVTVHAVATAPNGKTKRVTFTDEKGALKTRSLEPGWNVVQHAAGAGLPDLSNLSGGELSDEIDKLLKSGMSPDDPRLAPYISELRGRGNTALTAWLSARLAAK